MAAALQDPRRQKSCQHRLVHLLRQRVYGLAGVPTLCRLENRATHETAWRIAEVLVEQFIASHRQVWPKVRIIFRGDSGFCRWRMLRWCEKHGVYSIVGLAKNNRINELSAPYMATAERRFTRTGSKQKIFTSLLYSARTWDRKRRVLVKAEYTSKGPNQFRLLLSSLAYVLVETIRRLGLRGTELACAQCDTIRLKLFKIGAVIIRNTRRIFFHLTSAYPWKSIFLLAAHRLARE